MHKTPLNDFHREQGARLMEFAGWEMPVMYTGIKEEHAYTREHCSLFDVSHMGRIEVLGEGAEAFLQRVCTRNVGGMKVGLSRYSHICREDGGILDDVIVSRLEEHYLVVCNASNREKVLAWFDKQREGYDFRFEDRTFETGMVAIQGPEALETMGELLPIPLGDLKRYHCMSGQAMGASYFVARSGYTGEDGVEIIMPALYVAMAVSMLMTKSEELGRPIKPAGLGARDTLRFEAGMPLYGHELTEQWDSISGGQGWCVDLSKDFIGSAAMRTVRDEGSARKMTGLEVDSKRIPRQDSPVFSDGREVGVVTSGTHSPTLDKVIAMGLLEPPFCEPGTSVEIEVRGSKLPAKAVPLPFYKRQKK